MAKTVFITGATDGIGKETAMEIARAGNAVIIHGRSHHKVEDTVNELRAHFPATAFAGEVADLSSLAETKAMAARIRDNHPEIDVLINNAGVYMHQRQLTVDGFEVTFAVNHLAHFALSLYLLSNLRERPDGRIITVSSVAHTRAKLDFTNLNAENHFEAYNAYAVSKLANVLFSAELAERVQGTRVTVNSLHPGVITTKLLKSGFGISGAGLKEGAETSVYLALDKEAKKFNGLYFSKKKPTIAHILAEDIPTRQKLWTMSEEMTGVMFS
jgi:NAD(P)-dependent dehydrogenase (short-subunit alcohol dehydrogenase family)